MTRNKVFYRYIHNDNARKASFRKRILGLLKKLEELSILCGIIVCGIVFSPDEEEPRFWPSELEVEYMLRQYESIPYMEKSKTNMDQETYMTERVRKLEEQVKQLESSNRDMVNNHYLHQICKARKTFKEFLPKDLNALEGYVKERQMALGRRRKFMHQNSVGKQETKYEVGSNNKNSAKKQKMVIIPDPDAMPQCNVNGGSNICDISQLSHLNSIISDVNFGHAAIEANNYHTMGMYTGGFNVGHGNQGSANIINQGLGLPIGNINGNGVAGHGWLPHQGLSEGINDPYGQHNGQVGGTRAHGALHFPDNNNIFGARLLSSNLMDVEQPQYVSSTSYYNHVRGSGGGNVAQQLDDHYNWPNKY